MDPSSLREFVLLAVLIVLNGLFSASEIALVSVHSSRFRQLADQGNRSAAIALRLVQDSSRFLATVQVGVTLVGFLSSATAAVSVSEELAGGLERTGVAFLTSNGHTIALITVTILLAGVVIVFGELVPKTIALHHAERLALAAARPLDLLSRIFSPVVRLLSFISRVTTRLLGLPDRRSLPFVTEDEIKAMVDAGQEGGALEEDEKEMIYSVFEFGDTLTREVMVPRVDVIALEVNTPLLEAVDVLLREGHSRVPVYEGTIDNVVGLLNAKDLLVYLKDRRAEVPLRSILRKAYFVPETKRVTELLEEMQHHRLHAAVVVDEYGGTAGFVTVEDLVEEIVGELDDEYDVVERDVERVGPHEFIVNARMPVDDVANLVGTTLPSVDADSLGGLVLSRLGRVPAVGDKVSLDDVCLEVLSVSGRRVGNVRIRTQEHGSSGAAPCETRSDEPAEAQEGRDGDARR